MIESIEDSNGKVIYNYESKFVCVFLKVIVIIL